MPPFSIKRYLPRSLYGRAALILLVPIITLQLVVSIAFVQRLYEDVTDQMTQNITVELALLLNEVNAGAQPSDIAAKLAMTSRFSDVDMKDRRRVFDLSGRVILRVLKETFPSVKAIDLVENRKVVQMVLVSDRGPFFVEFPRRRVTASNPHQLIVLMIVTGALMTLIAYLFMRNQLRPIRRLALAAEAFGKGRHETYSPSGATEVRSAGTAFLSMRARIERQIEQRTLMLSGVSHDLRTPLTRLKLGLAMQEETPDTAALIGDVDEMEQLIVAFLDFARADATEELAKINPQDLLKTIVADAIRSGRNVMLGSLGDVKTPVEMRPMAIRRAIENLIGNAVRYGDQALVSLDVLDKTIRIRVEDNGPGIPAELREESLKPFARLDRSRNQNKGSGVGLGLAIAADITRTHGGSLRLGESEAMGGLSAEIVLPI